MEADGGQAGERPAPRGIVCSAGASRLIVAEVEIEAADALAGADGDAEEGGGAVAPDHGKRNNLGK